MPILRPKPDTTPTSRVTTVRRVFAASVLALVLALPVWQVGAAAPAATRSVHTSLTALHPHPLCDGMPVPC